MSKTDITPEGSVSPVFHDDTPQAPAGPPPIPDDDTAKDAARTALRDLLDGKKPKKGDVDALVDHLFGKSEPPEPGEN